MKTRFMAVVLGCMALAATTALVAEEAEKEKEFKAICPVSGGPAKEENSLEYHGKKVYFCCKNCPNAFKADTKKYAAKANYQLAETGQVVQVACPISGKPCNPDVTSDVGGVTVGFCCNGCKGKADKAGDEVLALLFGDLAKGYTLQTACPVSGKPIKTDKFVEHDGKKVYFCCNGCPAAFTADPAKFVSKLPQFSETDK